MSLVSLAVTAFTRAYLLETHRPRVAPSLRRGSVVPGLHGTLGHSDSRSALTHFTGSPLIRLTSPSPHSSWHLRCLTAGAKTGLSCSHAGCPTVPRPIRRGVPQGCTPPLRRLDPMLRRPGLSEHRRAATKAAWSLLRPVFHRQVSVSFAGRNSTHFRIKKRDFGGRIADHAGH